MYEVPSMSSKEFMRLLEKVEASFVRQGSTDHAIYSRIVNERRYSAPVMTGKKTLDPNYCKRVLRQLQFTNDEIRTLIQSK
jgi:predicted RNA binding protein YcfA (HicA-like mRNA interferase family)